MSPVRRSRIIPAGARVTLQGLVAVVALAGCTLGASGMAGTPVPAHPAPLTPAPTTSPVPPAANSAVPSSAARMFAYYYLWWDPAHWRARLGSSYPFSRVPSPLPAKLGADGCNPVSLYRGNQLTDVTSPLYDQSDPAQMASDVREAASAGLAGFAVGWAGTGAPGQSAASSTFNTRLASLVSVVQAYDAAGGHFKLWVSYMSSSRIRTLQAIDNDFDYLWAAYGASPVFDRSNGGRVTLILMGSRKYSLSLLEQVSSTWRSHFYLVGDENWRTWNASRAAVFDADQYYWSSEPPSAASYARIASLAAMVRSERNPDGSAKQFFSPLAPGYDKQLAGGRDCVPRVGGQTMRDLFAGNSVARPDAWLVISWNEITEGTYIMPLERYGTQSLATLSSIIAGAARGEG